MKSDSPETPFDAQLNDDVQSRRAQPTHVPVRIGPSAPSADNSPSAAPSALTTPTPSASPVTTPKESVPTPVIIGLAMALGAICVVGASLGLKRAIKPLDPVYPTVTALPPSGNIVMQSPETVIKNPDETRPPKLSNNASAAPNDNVALESTPSVEISELPPITAPTPPNPPRDAKPSSEPNSDLPVTSSGKTSAPDTYPPAEAHQSANFEITPPPGFRLRQSGRRTIWQRNDGAQILVETGKAGDGSPRAGWQKLDRDLARRYGERYRSLGIREGTLAGQPAAIWEFELTGKDGVTRRKIDIGTKINGRGYAVLGSAPVEKFDGVRGEIEQSLNSFQVNAPEASPRQRRPRPAPTNAPEAASPLPEPEKTREPEKGY